MKKISLFSLILMLSLYNNSFTNKEFVFQKNLVWDSLNYAIGLLGIKSCDSKNHMEIKLNAAVNGTYMGALTIKDLQNIFKNYDSALKSENTFDKAINGALGLLNINLLTSHIKFCYQNLKIFRKSKKIAKFNKTLRMSLTNEKIKQTVWLTFNTIFPYLCYAAKKMYYDKVEFKDSLYIDTATLEDSTALLPNSFITLYIAKMLASMSENRRRYVLYKKVKREIQRRLRYNFSSGL